MARRGISEKRVTGHVKTVGRESRPEGTDVSCWVLLIGWVKIDAPSHGNVWGREPVDRYRTLRDMPVMPPRKLATAPRRTYTRPVTQARIPPYPFSFPTKSPMQTFIGAPWAKLVGALLIAFGLSTAGCKIEKVETADGSNSTATAESDTGTVKTSDGETLKVAYVTNGIASFWDIAEEGCKAASKELGVECLVRMPPDGAADQKRMLEELISGPIDGVAVSPINPENQTGILNQVAEATNLITHDSDAPESNRLAYIGMNNYDAGRMCGQLVKEALPDGGEVIIFVGRLGQLNADQRRQGVIDELLDRSNDPEREFDPADAVLKNDKYTILDTRTDNFDFALAKSRAEDAIAKYPNIGCMVGLFAYNPPNILEAVRGADKLGKIQVVGFDEDEVTLKAIQDGECHGTVVQNPYQYGYKSVELLVKLAKGDESAIPEGGFIDIPARAIRSDNVDAFWTELKKLTGKEEAEAASK